MSNLISVGLFRTVRSKLFYILLVLTALTMVYVYYNTYRLQLGPDFSQLDLYFFQFINANIVSAAVFCPLFLSSEYGDGALRNKLMVGRTRPQIYLANLAVNCLYGTAALPGGCGHWAVCRCPPAWLVPKRRAGGRSCSMFSWPWQLPGCARRCTPFFPWWWPAGAWPLPSVSSWPLGSSSWGQYLYLALSQEEVLTAFFYTDTGEMAVSEQPNPAYLTGFARQVYQFFYELTPGGQAYQILGMSAQSPLRMLGYSGLVFVLVTGLGLAIFQKKDVK